MFTHKLCGIVVFATLSATAAPSLFFSTGGPDGRMGMASRPSGGGSIEIEAADDFLLTTSKLITGATFTGLFHNADAADVGQVVVEIYRVFPNDSNVGRTSGPPQFSTDRVPTRVNSPSDVALESRDSTGSGLTFSTTELGSFTVLNSVLNGINPKPNQSTGGEGSVQGTEVLFDVNLTNPIVLAPGHYFFVPQVQLSTGDFYWLSAPKPIVAPGTTFNPDLQAWIRNEDLAPDWLRVGTDIVGGATPPTFNAAFTLSGTTVPEPSTSVLLAIGAIALLVLRRRNA